MKGRRVIKVGFAKTAFEVVLDRKVTILKGQSGTGKTTFVELIDEKLKKSRNSSIISLSSNAPLIVLKEGDDWKKVLMSNKGCIIISDEGNEVIETVEFAGYVKESDNYFLFVSRSGMLTNLTYSVYSVIEFKSEKKGNVYLTKSFQRYFETYEKKKPSILYTEDKGTGCEMMRLVATGFLVESANGKDNLIKIVTDRYKRGLLNGTCLLVDGAAFGGNIGAFNRFLPYIMIIAPESFEYLLLKTRLLYRFVKNEVDNTADYCEYSSNILTYENFYYYLLREVMRTRLKVAYTKSKLPNILKSEDVLSDIKALLPQIDFS